MMSSLTRAAIAATLAWIAGAAAASPAGQQITRAGEQASAPGPDAFFTGRVRVEPVWAANSDINASGHKVSFEPGARSAWHTHPAGQRLVVLSGVGRTQAWGLAVQEIRPGDVVWCPPGVKHWHGASPGSSMTHLAVTGTIDGNNVKWMEKVSDEEYASGTATSQSATARTGALSARQQAIIPIAAFSAAGDVPRLRGALHEGLDAGLTVNDIKEVLVQLYAYAGFPRSLNALGEFMNVVEARKQGGTRDAQGQLPRRPIPKGEALLAAGTATQTKLVGAPVRGALFDFAPAAGEFLKTHLFGDIFARDNLDWPSRELATVGMLSALPGAESQLESHMGMGMNAGLTQGQLSELAQVLAGRVDREAAERARQALKRHLEKRKSP